MKIFSLVLVSFLFLPRSQDLTRHEFSKPLMGTEFRITLYASDSLLAKAAATAAFQRVESLEQIMSDYREDSEISQLSAISGSGTWSELSHDLWAVLSYGQTVSKQSCGAFDMTSGTLTRLWRRAFRQKEFPDKMEIEKALQAVGYNSLILKKRKGARLNKPGMRLDLGGIAKGYAVDEALKTLHHHGIYSALVDGGGDLAAGLAPPGTAGWRVEYFTSHSKTEVKLVQNLAVATSGDTYRYLEWEGKRYSHIINPRTGMGITSRRLVTVFAPACMEADAWATAASVGISEKLKKKLAKKEILVNVVEE